MAEGTAYKHMQPKQKLRFIIKLIITIVSFGFIFPNIMSD